MQNEIRTRFAPSPSGFLHVGGARTALFNYLYAKANQGKFILRMEDTDRARSTEESFQTILASLKWLGITWEEGPEIGGDFGPYVQSERLPVYQEHTERLLKEDKAYRCFCTPEELEERKKGNPDFIYDGKCANLTPETIAANLEANKPFSIRFRTPEKSVVVPDLVQGKVTFNTKLFGDFIIVKSDGFPSYNYAVVVDDALMKISHVIRGVGHLSNTPRQIVLFEAFGYKTPAFAHVSEIVGSDGKKLSKRAGATSVLAFQDLGYMPECFVNYMSLLGWTPEDENEFMPEKQAEYSFDVQKCSKAPATFDVFKKPKKQSETVDFNSLGTSELAGYLNPKSKLNWLSNKYIRTIPIEKLAGEIAPFLQNISSIPAEAKDPKNHKLHSILSSIRVYLNRLTDAKDYLIEFYNSNIEFDSEEAKHIAQQDESQQVAKIFYQQLQNQSPEEVEGFKQLITSTGELSSQKGRNLFMPIRVFTTGKMHGLELPVLFALLGQKKLRSRITSIANLLGVTITS
ncbi:MAG: glutamate--tRNA ligase [Spirochaetota bacterium]